MRFRSLPNRVARRFEFVRGHAEPEVTAYAARTNCIADKPGLAGARWTFK
jgi:hypothetical protein